MNVTNTKSDKTYKYAAMQSSSMVKTVGPLEKHLLDILYEKGAASAREICSGLEESGQRRTYSTVRTILNRLVRKKMISQKLADDGRTYIYAPRMTEDELGGKMVQKVMQDLMTRFEKSTISYLSENLADNDEELKKIKKKLMEMKKRG